MNQEAISPPLIVGRVYVYVCDWPRGCKGGMYRIARYVLNVPSYQHQVLLHCLSGNDKGIWLTCTPANFVTRYVPLVESATKCEPPVPPRTVPQVEFPRTVANISTTGKE